MTPVAAPDVRAPRRTDVGLVVVTHESVVVATGADPAAAPDGGGSAW
jgi:hypothetical protein